MIPIYRLGPLIATKHIPSSRAGELNGWHINTFFLSVLCTCFGKVNLLLPVFSFFLVFDFSFLRFSVYFSALFSLFCFFFSFLFYFSSLVFSTKVHVSKIVCKLKKMFSIFVKNVVFLMFTRILKAILIFF